MINIRKAGINDALGIAIVNVYTWKTTYSGLIPGEVIDARIKDLPSIADRIKNDLNQGKGFYVAETDNAIIGFCMYGQSRNDDYCDSGEIYALYVLDGYQSREVGKRLFLEVVDDLISDGKSSMIINCLHNNSSNEFYKRMGGIIVGQRQDTIMESELVENILYYEDLDKIRTANTRYS